MAFETVAESSAERTSFSPSAESNPTNPPQDEPAASEPAGHRIPVEIREIILDYALLYALEDTPLPLTGLYTSAGTSGLKNANKNQLAPYTSACRSLACTSAAFWQQVLQFNRRIGPMVRAEIQEVEKKLERLRYQRSMDVLEYEERRRLAEEKRKIEGELWEVNAADALLKRLEEGEPAAAEHEGNEREEVAKKGVKRMVEKIKMGWVALKARMALLKRR